MKIGDLVKCKFNDTPYDGLVGIITKVYDSPVKITVEVSWINPEGFDNPRCTIEPWFLVRVS